MGFGKAAPMTTRFTRPVTSIADIEALERSPYDSLIPARNLHHLFEATAKLHPDRPGRGGEEERGAGEGGGREGEKNGGRREGGGKDSRDGEKKGGAVE